MKNHYSKYFSVDQETGLTICNLYIPLNNFIFMIETNTYLNNHIDKESHLKTDFSILHPLLWDAIMKRYANNIKDHELILHAQAKCHPNDTFDATIGEKLASIRADRMLYRAQAEIFADVSKLLITMSNSLYDASCAFDSKKAHCTKTILNLSFPDNNLWTPNESPELYV